MFEIQNGATLTIIDSSAYGMKNGKYVKGESTGKIFANAMMINHQKWDLHYYTHRDIFLVSDGNLVIHGGTFQAGRQDDQYASNFSWNALKEVIGQAVTLGVSVYTYATGLDAAVAAKEDFMETDYYKDTEETPEEGDSGSDSGGTTKKDGENGKPTKDSKEDTPTADGNEAAKKDQTVASKQSAKNNPEGAAQEQATRGDDSEENEADEEKVAKKGQNTKVAEFNKKHCRRCSEQGCHLGHGGFRLCIRRRHLQHVQEQYRQPCHRLHPGHRCQGGQHGYLGRLRRQLQRLRLHPQCP